MKYVNYMIMGIFLITLGSCIQGEGMKSAAGESYTIQGDLDSKAQVEGLYDENIKDFNFTVTWNDLFSAGSDQITGINIYKGDQKKNPIRKLKYSDTNSSGSYDFILSSYAGLSSEEEKELLNGDLYIAITTAKDSSGIVRGQLVAQSYDGSNSYKIKLIKLKNDVKSFMVPEDSTSKLPVLVNPYYADNTKLKYVCLTPDIFSIDDNGQVKGIHVGIGEVQVSSLDGSNITGTFNIKVSNPDYISDISFSNSDNLIAIKGEAPLQLKWTISPDSPEHQTILFTSSDPSIATVDQKGVVTALNSGTVTITATATETGISGKPETRIAESCQVKVFGIYQLLDRSSWSVTATSWQKGNEPKYAIDGNGNTIWHNRWGSGTGTADLPQTFTIDFGQEIGISQFELDRRNDSQVTDVNNVDIYLGDQLTKMTKVGSIIFGDKNSTTVTGRLYFGLTKARYANFVFTKSNRDKWVSAAEIRGYLIK